MVLILNLGILKYPKRKMHKGTSMDAQQKKRKVTFNMGKYQFNNIFYA